MSRGPLRGHGDPPEGLRHREARQLSRFREREPAPHDHRPADPGRSEVPGGQGQAEVEPSADAWAAVQKILDDQGGVCGFVVDKVNRAGVLEGLIGKGPRRRSDFGVGPERELGDGSDLLGGYYRFAIVRNDRFEIGPSVGIGYLWLNARIRATGTVTGPGGSSSRRPGRERELGSITGAVGGYASGWAHEATRRVRGLPLHQGESGRLGGLGHRLAAGCGLLHLPKRRRSGCSTSTTSTAYDRGILMTELGGEITFKGLQVFLSFRF